MQNDEYFHGTLKYGPCFWLLENKTDKDRKKLELRVCSQQFEAIVLKFSITVIDDILQHKNPNNYASYCRYIMQRS